MREVVLSVFASISSFSQRFVACVRNERVKCLQRGYHTSGMKMRNVCSVVEIVSPFSALPLCLYPLLVCLYPLFVFFFFCNCSNVDAGRPHKSCSVLEISQSAKELLLVGLSPTFLSVSLCSLFVHRYPHQGSWDSLLMECQTCDRKVASLSLGRGGRRIFFSIVYFLC